MHPMADFMLHLILDRLGRPFMKVDVLMHSNGIQNMTKYSFILMIQLVLDENKILRSPFIVQKMVVKLLINWLSMFGLLLT